jgi:hypothetical protein
VSVVRGDVFEVARQWPHSVAMLDFCGPMADPLVEQVARSASVSRVRHLCLGYMRGRERPGDTLSVLRQRVHQALDERGLNEDPHVREHVVGSTLGFELCDRGGVPLPWFILQYQTRVPMSYQWFDVDYGGTRRERRERFKAWSKSKDTGHECLRQRNLPDEKLRDAMARVVRAVTPEVGAGLLNVSPARLAAWKAWQVRREPTGPKDPYHLRELYTRLWGGEPSPALV